MQKLSRIEFSFNWKITAFTLVLLPILVKLGFWQLEESKITEALQKQWELQQSLPAIDFAEHSTDEDFRRVRLHGEFLTEKYWLKENQLRDGKLGFQVIMPFALSDSDKIFAVDRGWIEGSAQREFIPTVETPKGPQTITGALVQPSDSKLVREADSRVKSWPHKILDEDLMVLSSHIEHLLYPQILRLDADSVGALTVYWRPVNMSSAKHFGYAIQWFFMAIALVVMFVCVSTNVLQLMKKS